MQAFCQNRQQEGIRCVRLHVPCPFGTEAEGSQSAKQTYPYAQADQNGSNLPLSLQERTRFPVAQDIVSAPDRNEYTPKRVSLQAKTCCGWPSGCRLRAGCLGG